MASRAHGSNEPHVQPPSEGSLLFHIKMERRKILCGTELPFSVHPPVLQPWGLSVRRHHPAALSLEMLHAPAAGAVTLLLLLLVLILGVSIYRRVTIPG